MKNLQKELEIMYWSDCCDTKDIYKWIQENYISKEILGLIYSDIKDLPELFKLKEKINHLLNKL